MDSYALCPCGSGKKVKFCCQAILPEMGKIERLQDNNQPRMALQLIDKLLKEHAENPWLVNQRAMSLIADDRCEDARDGLVAFLRKHADHPLSNGLLALSMTELEPIEQCKKVIHRAFLKSMAAEPHIVAILAGKLVDYHLTKGHEMAARQHMAVVLRLEREEERQRTLMAMLELDADTSIPYPLRGAQPLPHYQASEELLPQFKKAQRLYVHACFSEAADLLDQLVQKDDSSAQLWHTIGLMRVWDGDELRAAAALHKAAQLYTDTDQAVDVETIAQLLDQRRPDNLIAVRAETFQIESLSRLLTRLDNEDRMSRMPLSEEATQAGVIASFDVLNRPLPTDSELGQLTQETLPRSLGQITLFDRDEEGSPAVAHVNAIEGDRLAEAIRTFEATAGELASPSPADEEDEDSQVLGRYTKEDMTLSESIFFPAKMPGSLRNTLRRNFINKHAPEAWLEDPLFALGNRSPLAASTDESARIPLMAALRVVDANFDRRSIILDQESLRERLNLPADEPIAPKEDMDLNTLSVAQLNRLQTEGLSDQVFDRLMQRAMVVKHCGLGYRLLTEFLNKRPQLVEGQTQETEQAYANLADICIRSLRDEESLEWLERGFQFSISHGASFETQLMWKMRELSLRASDPESLEFKEILLELWNHYGAKLPAVRARLEEFVQSLEIEAPWKNAILTPQASESGLGAWTAQSEQTATAEKKLWIPE